MVYVLLYDMVSGQFVQLMSRFLVLLVVVSSYILLNSLIDLIIIFLVCKVCIFLVNITLFTSSVLYLHCLIPWSRSTHPKKRTKVYDTVGPHFKPLKNIDYFIIVAVN